MTRPADSRHYRADIDGLRAVAVASVVAYHAFPRLLGGGYVGVDVFFVISGFLISGILFRNLQDGTLSLLDFYARRVKRIFPSLLVVLAFTLLIGWLALFPDELDELGKHVAAGAAFASNLALWREAGYFDAAAQTKPLLHLWSLGIEEQFYIVWPAMVLVVWPRRWLRLPAILVAAGTSFALNVLWVHGHPVATFYLPFTRFWELLLGGLLAYRAQASPLRPGSRASALSLIGAFLYLVAMATFNRTIAFPGAWAALPTLGAILVIAAGESAWLNRAVLSHPAIVWIGLISYPLYLWHLPLLTLARILGRHEVGPILASATIVLSLALAWLTNLLVENPVRHSPAGGRRVIALGLLMALAGGGGLIAHRAQGFPHRAWMGSGTGSVAAQLEDLKQWTPPATYSRCPQALADAEPALNFCLSSSVRPPTRAILGDSHADHLFAGIAQGDPQHTWLLIGNSSCPPVLGIDVIGDQADCRQRMEKAIAYLAASPQVRTVVLSFWGSYIESTSVAADHVDKGLGPENIAIRSTTVEASSRAELFYLGLDEAVSALERASKDVVVAADVPELPFYPRDCVERPLSIGAAPTCSLAKASAERRRRGHLALLERLAARHPNLRVFDPFQVICPGERCEASRAGRLLYRDSHHLSAQGSEQVGRAFLAWFGSSGGDHSSPEAAVLAPP